MLAGIRHLDAQRRQVNKKLTTAVKSSGTTVTEIFGVGPVVAATVIGAVVSVAGSPPGATAPPTTHRPSSVGAKHDIEV